MLVLAVLAAFRWSSMLPYTIAEEDLHYANTIPPESKMFLSSSGLGRQPERLAALVPTGSKALVISNAVDYLPAEHRAQVVAAELERMRTQGYQPEAIDLREYFDNPQPLLATLLSAKLIWVTGGNTFILRRAMAQSEFDTIITEVLQQGIVYGGYSAGACVATPTLHGIHYFDPPTETPIGYAATTIWQGLGLVDYCIIPHHDPECPRVQSAMALFDKNNLAYRPLYDGEVIIVAPNAE